jgi:type III secretion control protein HpaP
MHPTTTHRPRIIEGPSAHAHEAPATLSQKLLSQAALFSGLRARAAARREEAARPVDQEHPDEADTADTHPDIVDACDRQGDDGNECGDDETADSGAHEPEASEHAADKAAGGSSLLTHASIELHAEAVHRACLQARSGAPAAVAPASLKPAPIPQRLIGSIVAQVADFCSNPAVLARGQWHITIPIDSELLPGCRLSLTLSYFDLSLRFETTDERSRQLILQHVTTLRESLQALMESRSEHPINIEITVM